MTTTHELKTWKEFYQAVVSGHKTFEVRRNDRNFQEGDYLKLIEIDPDNNFTPTGNRAFYYITYILKGEEWGIMLGYVVLGIVKLSDALNNQILKN